MHQSVMDFLTVIKARIPEKFIGQKVHEVGSLDINGSPRQFFTDCDYTGFDLGDGSGVDEVCHYADLKLIHNADVIVSTEALEHDIRWCETLAMMIRQLKHGGLLIITCATPRRGPHGVTMHLPEEAPFTNDYYGGIEPLEFLHALREFDLAAYQLFVNEAAGDLQFAAIKR